MAELIQEFSNLELRLIFGGASISGNVGIEGLELGEIVWLERWL